MSKLGENICGFARFEIVMGLLHNLIMKQAQTRFKLHNHIIQY